MSNSDLQKLHSLSSYFRRINAKIKLLSLLNRAKLAYEQNNYSECLESCRNILEDDFNNPIALRAIGCVMQSIGDNEKALEYYNKALNFSKNKEIEYTLIGTIYYNENDFEKAIEYYNMAIDVNDSYELAYDKRNQSMLENHVHILDIQDELIKRNLF